MNNILHLGHYYRAIRIVRKMYFISLAALVISFIAFLISWMSPSQYVYWGITPYGIVFPLKEVDKGAYQSLNKQPINQGVIHEQ